jgi:tetratricopeptide (TPR) repeat protein
MFRAALVATFIASLTGPAMATIDLDALWNFKNPAQSEQRFEAALANATPDDALILRTQIARTHGLRRDFAKAQEILQRLEPQIATASAEAQVRHALEWGRSFASATHPPQSQTPQALQAARGAFERAFQLAKAGQLDALAIDALHMLAFVDTAPADQLRWGREALAVVLASTQPAARAWEASIRNNIGYALHQLGRFDEALAEFQGAVVVREAGANAAATRIAYWMVAWTLRSLGRIDDALQIQLRLERENDAAGEPDPYVFEELEQLYRAKQDEARTRHYADRHKAAQAR